MWTSTQYSGRYNFTAVRGEYAAEEDMDENGYVTTLDARVIRHVMV